MPIKLLTALSFAPQHRHFYYLWCTWHVLSSHIINKSAIWQWIVHGGEGRKVIHLFILSFLYLLLVLGILRYRQVILTTPVRTNQRQSTLCSYITIIFTSSFTLDVYSPILPSNRRATRNRFWHWPRTRSSSNCSIAVNRWPSAYLQGHRSTEKRTKVGD